MIRNTNIVHGDHNIFVPAKLNFGEFILEKMWGHKEKTCFINGITEDKITYGEIVQQAMNIAVSLTHLGVRKGQTVGIFSENRNEYFPALIGAVCTGAAATTVNVSYTKGELKHVLSISKPNTIFCSPFTYKIHAKTLKSLDFIKNITLFGDSTPGTVSYNSLAFPNGIVINNSNYENKYSGKNNAENKYSGKNNIENNYTGKNNAENNYSAKVFDVRSQMLLRNVKYDEFEVPEVKGQEDTLFILYSSGTTGLPKGVMLTHLNIVTSCCLPVNVDSTFFGLTITPWFHTMGLVGNLGAFCAGRTAIYMPKFEVEKYLQLVERYKITQLTVVPPVLIALCKSGYSYDISSVQVIYSGAAPLREDNILAAKKMFPNAVALQGYGMTETTLAVTRDTTDMAHLSKPGSVGRVVAGTILKVADLQTGEPLGPNQRGEICAKGPLIMKGYVGKPPGSEVDDDGFFKTGDIGYYDADGCFFIVDRLKELIKYKAYQVPPAEIEAVILTHPGVKDAGVVGIEHPTGGEVPLAFVVRQPESRVSEEEVKAFVAERLSNPKHLRGGVKFIEAIPKNPSGKIMRRVLKQMAKNGRSKL